MSERSDGTDAFELDDLDVAVAHWHINAWGGAEYLVTHLAETLDVDAVYTLGEPGHDDPNPYGDVAFKDVTPSLEFPAIRRLQRRAGRTFEYAQWEDIDWREFGDPDVLVTSGATTRAVITPDDTLHVNYCHSPPRWFYDLYHDRKDSTTGVLARPLLRYLRTRDMVVDPRVDHYFVNSPIIERRLWKYYKREAEVLYPPVELERYYDDGDDGFYLHLGRLDEEKGLPTIVEAFDGLDERLVLAGGLGDIEDQLRRRIETADNIEWRGFVDDEEKIALLSTCTAVVFNGWNEDFGIVPIEANASGKPVLARNEGFPGVFVTDGENGFRHNGSATGIRKAVRRGAVANLDISPADYVAPFSLETFQDRLRTALVREYSRLRERVASDI